MDAEMEGFIADAASAMAPKLDNPAEREEALRGIMASMYKLGERDGQQKVRDGFHELERINALDR